MMLRDKIALGALLFICGCTKPTKVPTVEEFTANQSLLTDWMQKCTKGEYSNLGADETARLCGSAEAASTVLTQKARAKANADLFKADTLQ